MVSMNLEIFSSLPKEISNIEKFTSPYPWTMLEINKNQFNQIELDELKRALGEQSSGIIRFILIVEDDETGDFIIDKKDQAYFSVIEDGFLIKINNITYTINKKEEK